MDEEGTQAFFLQAVEGKGAGKGDKASQEEVIFRREVSLFKAEGHIVQQDSQKEVMHAG